MSEDLRKYLQYAMMLITTYAVVAIMLSMLMACKTNKHVEHKRYEADSLAMVVNDIRFDRKWFENYKMDSTWENDYWHIKVYDTTKPIDSMTNLPPLLADVRHKKEQSRKTEEKTVKADTTAVVTKTDIVMTHEETEDDEEDVVVESKPMPMWRWWTFVAFLVGALLMIKYGKGIIYTATTSLLNKIFK